MKNNPEINLDKQEEIPREKPLSLSRRSSRMSISSNVTFSHRPSIVSNPRQRSSRSFSRTSFSLAPDHLRLIKTIRPTATTKTNKDNQFEILKNGIHVQFRLSKKDQVPQQQQRKNERTLLFQIFRF